MVAGLVVPKSFFFRSGDNRAVAKGQSLLFRDRLSRRDQILQECEFARQSICKPGEYSHLIQGSLLINRQDMNDLRLAAGHRNAMVLAA